MDELQSLRTELERLVRTDNKDGFSALLRSHPEKFPACELLKLVCLHDAVGCATTLLEGDAGLSIDINAPIEGRLFPLHFAAKYLSCRLTKLFLLHGDQSKIYNDILPLSEALEALCHNQYVRDWTPKKSIFKLFYILCLQELREALHTIGLLASSTGQVESVFFRCIEEGKIVQLTALLMVARNKLMDPCVEGGLENTQVMQYITRELKVSYRGVRCSSKTKTGIINFQAAQDVVRALWSSVDVLEGFRCSEVSTRIPKHKVPYEVAFCLFADAGLLLKPRDVYCDDIECLRAKLSPEREAWLKKALERQMSSKSFSCNSIVGPLICSAAQLRGYSHYRAFHTTTSQAANYNFIKPVRDQLSRTSQVKPSFPKVLTYTRIFAWVVWNARRIVK